MSPSKSNGFGPESSVGRKEDDDLETRSLFARVRETAENMKDVKEKRASLALASRKKSVASFEAVTSTSTPDSEARDAKVEADMQNSSEPVSSLLRKPSTKLLREGYCQGYSELRRREWCIFFSFSSFALWISNIATERTPTHGTSEPAKFLKMCVVRHKFSPTTLLIHVTRTDTIKALLPRICRKRYDVWYWGYFPQAESGECFVGFIPQLLALIHFLVIVQCIKTHAWRYGGAASVVSATLAIAKLKLPVNPVVCTPLTENMPRPRFLVRSSSKRFGIDMCSLERKRILSVYITSSKTVEVGNTDVEGRLVLSDTIYYTSTEYKPHTLVDVATLMGAPLPPLPASGSGSGSGSRSRIGGVRRGAALGMAPATLIIGGFGLGGPGEGNNSAEATPRPKALVPSAISFFSPPSPTSASSSYTPHPDHRELHIPTPIPESISTSILNNSAVVCGIV
ncbi:hypothetical protein VKT23_013951 [Stygiomarasmius scandens]|uniref:Cytosol aminopeptidase domain-containing protein n=1 Tax=Marasmiellus scandens TaxID=2682957 RepID=A0ABR1J2V6_9AGAR